MGGEKYLWGTLRAARKSTPSQHFIQDVYILVGTSLIISKLLLSHNTSVLSSKTSAFGPMPSV